MTINVCVPALMLWVSSVAHPPSLWPMVHPPSGSLVGQDLKIRAHHRHRLSRAHSFPDSPSRAQIPWAWPEPRSRSLWKRR